MFAGAVVHEERIVVDGASDEPVELTLVLDQQEFMEEVKGSSAAMDTLREAAIASLRVDSSSENIERVVRVLTEMGREVNVRMLGYAKLYEAFADLIGKMERSMPKGGSLKDQLRAALEGGASLAASLNKGLLLKTFDEIKGQYPGEAQP